MSFCEVLKDLRTERDITQKEVAFACGLTPTCICQLESGSRNPTGSTIRELAKFFGCSADYLLEIDNYEATLTSPTAPALTAEEQKLIEDYRGLGRPLKDLLQEMIRTWQSSDTADKAKRI